MTSLPKGFRGSGIAAGIKSSGNRDLALIVNDGPHKFGTAVFTSNRVHAAPVAWSKQVIADKEVSAVILNSGGANACTGPEGFADTHKTAEVVSAPAFVNTDINVIQDRMMGRYNNGIGKTWDDPHAMKFYNDGYVTFPFLSDGMWFLTQHRRWGLLKTDPDYLAVARQINRIDIFKEASSAAKTFVAKDPMRTSKLIDGTVWDGKDPKKYAASFKVRVG